MKQKQKRILMLGGIQEQIIAIQTAKDMGLYVITCDNRPDNPGHQFADEYYNVSITDKEAVLELALKLDIDAVVCYALEAGVQSAAYAQEKMGKPTSPYRSVHTLSNKKLFRQFLKDNGFTVPKIYAPGEEILYPVVVKPTDLWGSRGITKVDCKENIHDAIAKATQNSLSGEFIIEEFIEGRPIEGDAFAIDGKLKQYLWGDVHYDISTCNPLSPIAFSFPANLSLLEEKLISNNLQHLFDLLHMQTNAYNIEMRIVNEGLYEALYLMEVAPRSGGSILPIMVQTATGVDIIKNTILAALGEDCQGIKYSRANGLWANYKVHTNQDGVLSSIDIEKSFKENNLHSYYPNVNIGNRVTAYNGSNCTIGNIFAKFESREDLKLFIANSSDIIKVKVI